MMFNIALIVSFVCVFQQYKIVLGQITEAPPDINLGFTTTAEPNSCRVCSHKSDYINSLAFSFKADKDVEDPVMIRPLNSKLSATPEYVRDGDLVTISASTDAVELINRRWSSSNKIRIGSYIVANIDGNCTRNYLHIGWELSISGIGVFTLEGFIVTDRTAQNVLRTSSECQDDAVFREISDDAPEDYCDLCSHNKGANPTMLRFRIHADIHTLTNEQNGAASVNGTAMRLNPVNDSKDCSATLFWSYEDSDLCTMSACSPPETDGCEPWAGFVLFF